jgi:hypothetical protein
VLLSVLSQFYLCSNVVDVNILIVKAGPNVDLKKWQDEQIDKATVRFSAKDAKERNKV